MNQKEFEAVFQHQVALCEQLLVIKARSYADDTDRLHNFNVSAVLGGDTPAQALWGMARKHIVSISDMVRKDGQESFDPEVWDEKLTDAINYFILLRAVVTEQWENVEDCEGRQEGKSDSEYLRSTYRIGGVFTHHQELLSVVDESDRQIRIFGFCSREEVVEIIAELNHLIKLFGYTTVANLYYIFDGAASPTWFDTQWGWRDLSSAKIHTSTDREGFVLELPDPDHL